MLPVVCFANPGHPNGRHGADLGWTVAADPVPDLQSPWALRPGGKLRGSAPLAAADMQDRRADADLVAFMKETRTVAGFRR